MVTDPIADLLTRIRNANQRSRSEVEIPATKMLESIVKILKEEEYVSDYKVSNDKEMVQQVITVMLKYEKDGTPALTHLERISKPGLRRYVSYKEIKPVLNNMGIGIISTPKGVMSHKQAIDMQVGGEYLCNIW